MLNAKAMMTSVVMSVESVVIGHYQRCGTV